MQDFLDIMKLVFQLAVPPGTFGLDALSAWTIIRIDLLVFCGVLVLLLARSGPQRTAPAIVFVAVGGLILWVFDKPMAGVMVPLFGGFSLFFPLEGFGVGTALIRLARANFPALVAAVIGAVAVSVVLFLLRPEYGVVAYLIAVAVFCTYGMLSRWGERGWEPVAAAAIAAVLITASTSLATADLSEMYEDLQLGPADSVPGRILSVVYPLLWYAGLVLSKVGYIAGIVVGALAGLRD